MSNQCLNCNTSLQGSFCHKCGQKSSTHRITFAQFIKHDLIHGVLHLDKGVLYTLKTLIYTPGYAAREFIKGKRVMHYNIFALFLIIIAIKTLLDLQLAPPEELVKSDTSKHTDHIFNEVLHRFYKAVYFLMIPLVSVCSFVVFKKLKYNFTEHVVLGSFILAGGFFYALGFSLVGYATQNLDFIFYGFSVIPIYLVLGYYQASVTTYSFAGSLWRSLLVIILFISIITLVFFAVVLFAYGGNFEGTIGIEQK